jgi:hypothetical protein
MKKQIILAPFILGVVVVANGQLKVQSNTNTHIGGNSNQLYPEKLTIEGNVRYSNTNDALMHYGAASDGTGNAWGGWVLRPENSGMMDIGTENHRMWDIHTNYLYYNNMFKWSDARTKEEITPTSNLFSRLDSVNVYSYKYKSEYRSDSLGQVKDLPASGVEYGVLAQELQKTFPSLVTTTPSGMMAVDYTGLIPVLLQGIKEQQNQIEQQNVLIGSLQYKVQQLERQANLTSTENTTLVQATHLNQNFPNPFNVKTTVSYYIAETANSASIMIFDMAGTLIRTYKNVAKGNGEITIEEGQLTPGMYMYSLIVDGVELDSKRMILTK